MRSWLQRHTKSRRHPNGARTLQNTRRDNVYGTGPPTSNQESPDRRSEVRSSVACAGVPLLPPTRGVVLPSALGSQGLRGGLPRLVLLQGFEVLRRPEHLLIQFGPDVRLPGPLAEPLRHLAVAAVVLVCHRKEYPPRPAFRQDIRQRRRPRLRS